jgi:hypothetical protein
MDVWQYPDGTIELRASGTSLPFITYDRLGELDQGAIIDNKRLGRALEKIKLVQGLLSISKSVLEISSILDPRHSWNSYLRPE